jgi:hypothetical protein
VPWKDPCIAAGGGSSFSTFWIALTAAPREAPGARLKETVVAGKLPHVADQDRRRDLSEVFVIALRAHAPVGDFRIDVRRSSGLVWNSGSTSRITWYWFNCVNTVETCRWPKLS